LVGHVFWTRKDIRLRPQGQKARSGRVGKRGFEGGQTPLYKKLPKIMRFKNYPFKIEYEVVNVEKLNRFDSGTVVDIGTLVDTGLVSSLSAKVKFLVKVK